MALQFIVEDGSGLATATSYIAEADAEQYFENRPNHANIASWTAALSAAKQGALVEGTAWLDQGYVWKVGVKGSADQALDWPRTGAYDAEGYAIAIDEVPVAVERATCEVAIRILAGETFSPDKDAAVDGVKLGPLEVDFFGDGRSAKGKTFPAIDQILRGLVKGGNVRTLQRG